MFYKCPKNLTTISHFQIKCNWLIRQSVEKKQKKFDGVIRHLNSASRIAKKARERTSCVSLSPRVVIMRRVERFWQHWAGRRDGLPLRLTSERILSLDAKRQMKWTEPQSIVCAVFLCFIQFFIDYRLGECIWNVLNVLISSEIIYFHWLRRKMINY